MVFVAVREDDGFDFAAVFEKVGDIRDDDVDTEEFLRDHYRQNWAELFPPSLLEARHR